MSPRGRAQKAERRYASKIIDDCYKEFTERPRCLACNAPFTPTSPTQNYCGGACALDAMNRRLRLRQEAEVANVE